ncbi:hypothetical protein [Motiliproteus sediminis]|uniref:hypothetical protein n=1 Tax=Motiliproteus sediminis TaxID=1468178 RepID=UPI001AEF7255|nr:hypothetical protein [Motiliproteus sediminis]
MKEISVIYIERILQVSVGFFITYMVVNYFDPSDYGVYKYVVSLGSMFLILVLLGFNFANIRYIPEYLLRKEFGKIFFQVGLFAIIQCVLIVVVMAVVYTLHKNEIIGFDKRISIIMLSVLCLLYYIKSYFCESLYVALSKRLRLTYFRILLYFIQFAIVYFAIKVNFVDIKEFLIYIVAFSGVEVLVLSFGLLLILRRILPGLSVESFSLKEHFSYATNNYGFSWTNFLRDNAATIVLVSYLFEFTEVAYYSVALIIPNIVRSFSPSKIFSGFLMPEYVKSYARDDDKSVVFDGLNFMGKLNLLFLIPALIYSFLMFHPVIEALFGVEYAKNSIYLGAFLFLNILALSYLDLNLLLANIIKRSDLVLKINMLSVSNVVIIIFLHEMGNISIGIANLSSTILTVFVFWLTVGKIYSDRINFHLFSKEIVSYIVAISIFSLIVFNLSVKLYAVVFILVSPVIAILVIKSKFFNIDERESIKKMFPSKIKGIV